MKYLNCFIILFFLALGVNAQDSLKTTFGQGLPVYSTDSSFYMKFSTRFQNKFQATTTLKRDVTERDIDSRFLVRRARLKFSGYAYHPDLRYKMEFGLSDNDVDKVNPHTGNASNIVLDAVVKWDVRDNLSLWAGQTKLPSNRERVISSQELQFVDRSRVNANFTLDRDVGFQLRHHFYLGDVLVRDMYAFTQGEGRNIVDGYHGGYSYTGRLEVLPFGPFTNGGDYIGGDVFREKEPKLSIGGSYNLNQNAIREEGQTGGFLPFQRDLRYGVLDMMFKYKGFSLMSEYGRREAEHPVLDDEGDTFYTGNGFVIQSGYVFKNDLEVAGRYTTINPEQITDRVQVDEYTLALSRYFVHHHLKLQSDISYIDFGNGVRNLRFRLQSEVSF